MMDRFWGVGDGDGHSYTWRPVGPRGAGGDIPDVALLLLGEFQSVAEDLDSLLFITVSTCLGRLTVDTEHLPKKPRERHTDVHTWLRGRRGTCAASCATLRRRCDKHTAARHKVPDCKHIQPPLRPSPASRLLYDTSTHSGEHHMFSAARLDGGLADIRSNKHQTWRVWVATIPTFQMINYSRVFLNCQSNVYGLWYTTSIMGLDFSLKGGWD